MASIFGSIIGVVCVTLVEKLKEYIDALAEAYVENIEANVRAKLAEDRAKIAEAKYEALKHSKHSS